MPDTESGEAARTTVTGEADRLLVDGRRIVRHDWRGRGWWRGRGQPGEQTRGQALAEFALVIPVLFVTIAGIIQFGLIFWSLQTLTQVARDTGRWAATQSTCSDHALVAKEANRIAANSSLFGYEANEWSASIDVSSTTTNQVAVDWDPNSGTCPPADNQGVYYVTVRINHTIPVFFPFVPGNGALSTSAEFRMEPKPL